MQLYNTDELIGGSHYHNAQCPACLRFGYVTALSIAATIYQELEAQATGQIHEIMDRVCDKAGIDKMHVLMLINGDKKEENEQE